MRTGKVAPKITVTSLSMMVKNREERRKIKKKDPRLASVYGLLDPFDAFIKSLKTGDVSVDQQGNILMSMPGLQIDTQAKQGIAPVRALPNLAFLLELYIQVIAYCYTDEDMAIADPQVEHFKRRILNPLKLGSPISKEDIIKAENELLWGMRLSFTYAPPEKFARALSEILAVVEKNKTRKDVSSDEYRVWLVAELQKGEQA